MNLLDRVKFAASIVQGKVPANAIIKKIGNNNYPEYSDPKLSDVVEYFKRNVTFKLAVLTYAYRSSGMGSYHTVKEPDSSEGKKALELIDDFSEEWNMDDIDFKVARDGWMAGNAFLNLIDANKIFGLYMLPLSSFKQILRDGSGIPTEYVQQWGGRSKSSKPEVICHFRYNPVDEEAFGEGIGQAMARPGKGYQTEAGNTRKSLPLFEMQERMNDDISLLLHSGLPRYMIVLPEAESDVMDAATSKFETLDTLEHLVVNVKNSSIERIALDTQGKFDTFVRHVTDQVVTGTMSPLIRLWSSLDFTFASSKEATDAMDPSVQHFQRMHKRFDERCIYWPILMQNGLEPKKVKLRKNWGMEEKPKIELDHLLRLIELKAQGALKEVPEGDLVDILIDIGFKITKQKPEMEPVVKDVNESLNSFKRLSELWS